MMKDNKVLIIAEVGQAHEGSLGILHSYIDAVATTGADAIKFQTHIAEAESSELEPFRVNFSYEDNSRFDYWKRMSFSLEHWKNIKAHCDEVNLEFISSPFSVAAVNLLEEVGVSRYKIGSGEVTNKLMLDAISKTGKEVILSSGMSNTVELKDTVDFLKSRGTKYSILQCTTKYPTTPQDVGLNVIQDLAAEFDVKSGLSDHSGTIYPSLAAVAIGAKVLEVHVVFDKMMFGPDTSSSLTIDELRSLCRGVRDISMMLDSPVNKGLHKVDDGLKTIFGKSLAVNKPLSKGHVLELKDLESKKPGNVGVPAAHYETVLGKTLLRNLKCWDFLSLDDIK
ncbi:MULTISPECIES: N-acetylneuraminate synthase family protein [unclassified Agarivorans]|uniref:N-acetylneuraminate synthase family protein n=1 Tax=unclassified Agarivorans TaxID=2636026 RepID=UPI0026E2864B|nr:MULTISPECIES: N-acetylneuraminate synthase family protein [unclassified Agarivorans]MDO6686271.1 N-acetylneuraminate synthase family protein [Agarivorans sp. 3_MG-2023]MDO6716280.1 N-acetylneuraminate synthase family protein [Agarivorans sp. 2_MG-2023]